MATTSTLGTPVTHFRSSCLRPPAPIIPTRTRSFAPSTLEGSTSMAAAPTASPPMNSLLPIALCFILPPKFRVESTIARANRACSHPGRQTLDKPTRLQPNCGVLHAHHRQEWRLVEPPG